MKRQIWRSWVYFAFVVVMSVVLLATLQAAGYADAGTRPMPPEGEEGKPYVPPLQPPPHRANQLTTTYTPATVIANQVLDMKVLVIDGSLPYEEGIYNTATAYLDILGVPYDTLDTSLDGPEGTIEASDLWDGASHGYYYAVFVTTSNVWWGLSADEQAVLETYMRDFGVRQVTWYAYPSATPYGLDFVRVVTGDCGATPGNPFDASLTTAGADAFHYLKSGIALPIDGPCFYGYIGQPTADADVTPLLLDGDGDTLLALYRPDDGREHLVMTVGSYYPVIPPDYIHARLLPYGLINWATRGIFLGERHFYFSPQPDDVLSGGDTWDLGTHSYQENGYRNSADELQNLVNWQTNFRATEPNAAAFHIEMPFNGLGALQDRVQGVIAPGTLTAKAIEVEAEFTWLNHTYTHLNLDVDQDPYPGYAICTNEIYNNTLIVNNLLGFTDYSVTTLLTGEYSGLVPPNPDLADAAYNLGVRYMLVNASLPDFNNPTPNTGIPHPTRSAILLVPRYANNIYYAVTTPEQETDMYNIFYCPGYVDSGYTNPCFTYEQIINSITNQAFGFMLDFSVNATMFHMNNFGDYGDGRTVMTDFIEQLYGKYNTYHAENVPVLSPRTQDIGALMRQRMAYDASGVSGQLSCGNEIRLHVTGAATIPLTGILYGGNTEVYASQPISYVAMTANETRIIPGEEARIPTAITDLAVTRNGADLALTWSPISQDTMGGPLTAAVYRVYARANDPYFSPTPADLLAEVTEPGFTHLNGVGDVANNYTYVVTAVGNNCWYEESAFSNRVGEFDFSLTETSGTDFNWIALPLDAGLQHASDLVEYIALNSSGAINVPVVERWVASSQNYQSYVALPIPFGDFELSVGGAYRLSVEIPEETAVIWTLVGRVPDPTLFSYPLLQTNDSDFNWITLPLQQNTNTLASLLQGDIETNATPQTTVFTVERWNASGQNFQTFLSQPTPIGDFPIYIGYPYRVSVAVDSVEGSVWP